MFQDNKLINMRTKFDHSYHDYWSELLTITLWLFCQDTEIQNLGNRPVSRLYFHSCLCCSWKPDGTWEQPRCPSIEDWVNNLWIHLDNGILSTLKGNELSNHEKIWKRLKHIILNESSQSEKVKYWLSLTILPSGKGKTIETRKISCQGLGSGTGMNKQRREDF